MAYAHSPNERGEWHDLVEHLRGTATSAEEFASDFGAGELGRFLGLAHDAGKFDPEWQRYLKESAAKTRARGTGPDHKAAGADIALHRLEPLALLIRGHHGGLTALKALKAWLADKSAAPGAREAMRLARAMVPELDEEGRLPLPPHVEKDPRALELFLRLLFSALVDADWLDTERHKASAKAVLRGSSLTPRELWARSEASRKVFADAPDTPVNRARAAIYDACLAATKEPPGLFRLTVPTGGGKTRSAMAFALRHAMCHGQRRVIVAVPFISITQQTASVYRGIFDDPADAHPAVLEHHSDALTKGVDDEEFGPAEEWARLSAENWDAPIIVTTTVQLFESLFAAKTSRVRRVHRLANSVVILDEAQALPLHLLDPILDGLKELCAHYNTTAVLSTATQPAFEVVGPFRDTTTREIVPRPERYFAALKRVSYEWRTNPPMSWSEVAGLMRGERQALAVLNTKKDALTLLDALDDSDAMHLSTMLCGAHRRRVVDQVKQRLKDGAPCRLVATQVVEAGVDIDFPLVLRALGPLDAVVQAAGRCNREGALPGLGRTIVFRPADGAPLPQGSYSIARGQTESMLAAGPLDLDDPETLRAYYRRVFQLIPPDRDGIQGLRESFEYPAVADKFHLVDDDTVSVIVTTHGTDEERRTVESLLGRLRGQYGNPRETLRALQPYIVSIRRREAERLKAQGFITEVLGDVGEWMGRYDDVHGIVAADQEYFR